MTAQTTEEVSLSLGSTYQITVTPDKKITFTFDQKSVRRLAQYALQTTSARIINSQRVAQCRRSIIPGRDKVRVLYSQKLARAHYGNLMVCGALWICPICAARITERRREDLSKGIDTFIDLGGSVFMAAFTLQHDREDRLQDTKEILFKAFDRFGSGKGFQKIKKEFGYIGNIRALEVTWSNNAGWHPHIHVLYFSENKLTPKDISELQEGFSKRYCSILKSLGRYGSQEIAVKLSFGDHQKTKDYLFKWGLSEEITKGKNKKARHEGYTPFELLAWAQTGEVQPVYLFREYYEVFKGSRQLKYSKGLRPILDLGVDQTDKELAEENTAEAVLLAQIDREVWKAICNKRLRGEVLEWFSMASIDLVVDRLNSLDIKIVLDNDLEGLLIREGID